MSPLQVAPDALPVPAAALTGTHLGRATTTPPSISTAKLAPVTGTLTAVRQYRSSAGQALTTLEVTEPGGKTSARTVLGDTVITLRRMS